MNCDGVRGLLSAYVDGELSAGELLRVEQHLRRCHWCADEVDALRQTIALVASLEEVEVPLTFQAQLHERLVALGPPVQTVRTAQVSRARRQDFRRWATPAAAAAAALVIGVAGLKGINLPTPVGPATIGDHTPSSSPNSPDNNSSSGNEVLDPTGTTEIAMTTTASPVQPTSGPERNDTVPPGKTETIKTQETPTTSTGTTAPTTTLPVNPRGVYTVSVPFLTDVQDPGSLPVRMQYSASVTATSADVEALADLIAQRFATVNRRQPDPVSGIVQIAITVPNAEFLQALKWVEQQTGAPSADSSHNLGNQIAGAYDRLIDLETKRKDIEKNREGVTDEVIIELAEKELALLKAEAEQAKEAYKILTNQIANGTISVTLKPAKAQ